MIAAYSEFVELALNADRVRARRTVEAADAIDIATQHRSIPSEWFPWLTDSPHEADRLKAEQNASLFRSGR